MRKVGLIINKFQQAQRVQIKEIPWTKTIRRERGKIIHIHLIVLILLITLIIDQEGVGVEVEVKIITILITHHLVTILIILPLIVITIVCFIFIIRVNVISRLHYLSKPITNTQRQSRRIRLLY